jgi:putative ABC transport system permease protein
MTWIALKMLTGDRSKFFAILFGVTFACLLIAQQSAIFCGIMLRTTSTVRDIFGADLWVMNSGVRYADDLKAISDNDVYRVRGVPGVLWAVNFYKGAGQAQLASGQFQAVILLGVDDASLAGAPIHMLVGSVGDLQKPDAILVDEAGFHYMWPGEPLAAGKVIEMNDRRAVVAGIFRASQTFTTQPIVYTRASHATLYVPPYRRMYPFVLAKAAPGTDPEVVARRIAAQTGLQALSKAGFIQLTMMYYLRHTGIPLNFGTTTLLGFLVGAAIAGQSFYLFTVENLKQFGTLKAMGMTDRRLVGLILIQALVVGGIGYGLGIGLATLYGIFAVYYWQLMSFFLPWQVLALTGAAVLVIVVLASLLSIRRVLVLEPATVFQGGT